MQPQQIGKYKVIKKLGQGGFGAVYLAEDPALKTQVAIKVFHIADPELAKQATSATTEAGRILHERFLNEARILRQLAGNPHIVDIYEFDQMEDGLPYYVMPYLANSLVHEMGKDALTAAAIEELDPDLRPRKLSVPRAIQILTQVLTGLNEVHKAELIHRDIKPANILFDDKGNAQLCDFGIAKAPDAQHSQSGMAMGSRNYMSPEQRESAKHVTPRSDVYSVGILAYRMFTGTLPQGRFEDPIAYSPGMGQELNDLIISAIESDPQKRPQDGAVFLTKLKKATRDDSPIVSGGDDFTGTDMGDAPNTISDELRPLRGKIKSFLLATVELTPKQYEQLELSAEVLGVDGEQLKKLIEATTNELEPQLKPLRNFLNAVDKKLRKNKGKLSKEERELLIQAGAQSGQDRGVLEKLLVKRVAATKSEIKQAPKQKKSKRKAPLILGGFAFAALAGSGVYYSQFHTGDEALITEADETVESIETEQQESETEPDKITSSSESQPSLQEQPTSTAEAASVDQPAVDGAAESTVQEQPKVPPKQYLLWVATTPINAKIVLPDIVPKYEPGLILDAGKYRVVAKADGYETQTVWVDLTESDQEVSIVLKEQSKSAKSDVRVPAYAQPVRQPPKGFVEIPAGRFQMGCVSDVSCARTEKPIHTVFIKAFYLQEHEVTFAQWDQCVRAGGCEHEPNDRGWGRDNRPVMDVSYEQITQQFIPWLNRKTGHNYRLPSEAEWEYAARANTRTSYSWGNEIQCYQAAYAVKSKECSRHRESMPVKSYQPNPWGLYDMHGNVWEWTADCWNRDYTGAPANGSAWQSGDCRLGIVRGGSWKHKAKSARAASRLRVGRTKRKYLFGFRLARDI